MTSLHHPPDIDTAEPVTDVMASSVAERPTAPAAPDTTPPETRGDAAPVRTPGAPAGLTIGAFLALCLSAWAGLVPFVGPTFGLSADGASSWTWDRVHLYGAVLPGALGVVAALFVIAAARRPVSALSAFTLRTWGAALLACGAWLTVVPVVWPAIVGPYFVAASPTQTLAHWLAYASGPGVLLTAFGAYTAGRAGRRPATSANPAT